MITDHEKLATTSDEDLADILVHINREKYPDRYNAVKNELVKRHGATIEGVSVDSYFAGARRRRPFAERAAARKKVLLAALVWTGLMLALHGVRFLVSELRSP